MRLCTIAAAEVAAEVVQDVQTADVISGPDAMPVLTVAGIRLWAAQALADAAGDTCEFLAVACDYVCLMQL